MQITQDTAVTVRMRITDAKGRVIDPGTEPVAYLHGNYGNTFPKLQQAIEGQTKGFKTTVQLGVDDAFGPRNDADVRTIPKGDFPPGVKVGGTLQDPDGKVWRVAKIKGPEVHLDGNHPLAGEALTVAVTVLDVRPASEEEIAHGHVHGAHGHHH